MQLKVWWKDVERFTNLYRKARARGTSQSKLAASSLASAGTPLQFRQEHQCIETLWTSQKCPSESLPRARDASATRKGQPP